MKKHILSLAMVLAAAPNVFAETATYKNNAGCTVEVEQRRNGTIYYISAGDKVEVLGVTSDLKSGTFVYCDDSALEIHSFEGSQGTGIMLSCSAHENGHATTRGKASIDIIGGQLNQVSIDGQVKGLLGWKQDTKVVCSDLKKQ